MTGRGQRRRVFAACLVVLAASVVAQGAQQWAWASPTGPKVLIRTTGNGSELRKSIRINRNAGRRHVIMSLPARELPSLEAGDRLDATAELQVTGDCIIHEPRCAGTPYHFNPIVDSRIMLARGRHVTRGPGAQTIASKRITCTQDDPERQHHCVIVFTHSSLRIRSERRLPCRPDACVLNFVVSAHNHQAHRRDRLVIGGNDPQGNIKQDKARLNAIRFDPGSQPRVRPRITHARVHHHVPLDLRNVVIFSQRLRHLDRNDQLAVNARWATTVRHLPYIVRLTSQLVLTRGRYATAPNRFVRHLSRFDGEVSEANGSNCIHRPRCVRLKTGVMPIRRPNLRGHHRVPLYVNLIAKSEPKGVSPRRGDRLPVLGTGGIKVTRYPASMHG